MVGIAKKITAVIHTSKDSDFPLAFLLRCTELSLDRGCASQIDFPTLISAKLRFFSSWTLRPWEDINTLTTSTWYTTCGSYSAKRAPAFCKFWWIYEDHQVHYLQMLPTLVPVTSLQPYFEGAVKMCKCSDFWQQTVALWINYKWQQWCTVQQTYHHNYPYLI